MIFFLSIQEATQFRKASGLDPISNRIILNSRETEGQRTSGPKKRSKRDMEDIPSSTRRWRFQETGRLQTTGVALVPEVSTGSGIRTSGLPDIKSNRLNPKLQLMNSG